MKPACLTLMIALCLWPMVVFAQDEPGGPAAPTSPATAADPGSYAGPRPQPLAPGQDFKQPQNSGEARYAEADAALNEARLAVSSPEAAKKQTERLQGILDEYPVYPYRHMVLYYLGFNYQILQQYDKAAAMFDAALRARPDLAATTSIVSYLKTARNEVFVAYSSWALIGILALVLAVAIWGLARRGPPVRWRRRLIVFGSTLLLWAAAVWVLPLLLGPPKTGLANYPRPTLVDFHLGQLGDRLLWGLLLYGAGAILAAMVVASAASRLHRPLSRATTGLAFSLLATSALMGLFYVRYCYRRCEYDRPSGRLIFMVRCIGSMNDVPDEMLPLYEPNFRERILKSREAGKN